MPFERLKGIDAEGRPITLMREVPMALPPEPERFPGLNRNPSYEQRTAGLEAFAAAVDAFVESNGPEALMGAAEGARSKLVAQYAHRLAVGPDGSYVLLIERPKIPAHPSTYDELYRREHFWPKGYLGSAGRRGCETHDEFFDLLWLDVTTEPLPFSEAIPLLLDAENPEAEVARRRSAIAEKKKAAAAARAAEEEQQQRRNAEAARWHRENEVRIAMWNKLTPREQALHKIADRMPAFRELLLELAAIERMPQQRDSHLPDSFFPELKGVRL